MLQCSSIYGQVLKTYFQHVHVCIQGTLCSSSLLMRGHFRYNFIAQLMFTRMLLGLHFASAHIWTALLLLLVCTQTIYIVSLLYRHRQAKWKWIYCTTNAIPCVCALQNKIAGMKRTAAWNWLLLYVVDLRYVRSRTHSIESCLHVRSFMTWWDIAGYRTYHTLCLLKFKEKGLNPQK